MSRGTVVVKIGSSTLVDARGRARPRVFAQVAADVGALAGDGTPVVLVSSGAIAMGLGSLGRERRSRRLPELQAASAIGQSLLLRRWEAALGRNGLRCAQVLLTVGDIHRRDGYLNARRTLETLLRWGRVPVVNENDSTATDEITFGDNDALAAQVAVLLKARLLVLLTDIDGLHDRDPRRPGAVPIAEVDDHRLLERLELDGGRSSWGSGGMRSKLVAAEMASTGGVAAVIASGHRPGALAAAAAGAAGGTRFQARPAPALRLQAVGALRQARARASRGGRRRQARRCRERHQPAGGRPAGGGGFVRGRRCGAHLPVWRAVRRGHLTATRPPTCGSWWATRGVDEAVHRDNLVML